MNNLEREYIAISFNDDSNIIPVIRMSGTDGLKKVIRGVSGISKIFVHHIDFINQTTNKIGMIQWPDTSLTSDVVIQYEPEEYGGTVHIMEIDQVWSYSVSVEGQLYPVSSIETDNREGNTPASCMGKKT